MESCAQTGFVLSTAVRPTGVAPSADRYPADALNPGSGRAANGLGGFSELCRQDRRMRRPLLDGLVRRALLSGRIARLSPVLAGCSCRHRSRTPTAGSERATTSDGRPARRSGAVRIGRFRECRSRVVLLGRSNHARQVVPRGRKSGERKARLKFSVRSRGQSRCPAIPLEEAKLNCRMGRRRPVSSA